MVYTFRGGIHPGPHSDPGYKAATNTKPIELLPAPDQVILPVSMHIGAPASPCVKVGDIVDMGQTVAEAGGFVSAPVHATVSGKVVAVEPRLHPNGSKVLSVVIENDHEDRLHESVHPYDFEAMSNEERIELIRSAGMVGHGGATFPTHVKIQSGIGKVDTIIVNAAECEPYITSDHRLLLERPEEVVGGLKMLVKILGVQTAIIGMEENKADAFPGIEKLIAGDPVLKLYPLKCKYPQGAEKMLIKRVMGRQVPRGGLPADVGAVVSNISTTKAISDAIQKGMPLVERVVTVTGEKLKKPGNYIVKIGTNTKDLIDYCGGITGDDVTIKAGGPMMGFVLSDTNVPIMKGSNGIIVVDTDHTVEQPCIKCGRCADVCPMELSPLYFAKFADEENWQGDKDMNIMDCIECRCCEYICSSKIPLVTKIKAGKNAVRGMK